MGPNMGNDILKDSCLLQINKLLFIAKYLYFLVKYFVLVKKNHNCIKTFLKQIRFYYIFFLDNGISLPPKNTRHYLQTSDIYDIIYVFRTSIKIFYKPANIHRTPNIFVVLKQNKSRNKNIQNETKLRDLKLVQRKWAEGCWLQPLWFRQIARKFRINIRKNLV